MVWVSGSFPVGSPGVRSITVEVSGAGVRSRSVGTVDGSSVTILSYPRIVEW